MTQRQRRRSRDVTLLAVPVLAAAFAGCGGNDSAYCVDRSDRIVENRYCDNHTNPAFFWYYGGRVANGGFRPGARITGGERVVSTNVAENAKRGGFGSKSSERNGGIGRSTGGRSGGG